VGICHALERLFRDCFKLSPVFSPFTNHHASTSLHSVPTTSIESIDQYPDNGDIQVSEHEKITLSKRRVIAVRQAQCAALWFRILDYTNLAAVEKFLCTEGKPTGAGIVVVSVWTLQSHYFHGN
jgi:hypothetical protein